ncbi:MAG: hypothetical protein OEW15_05665 [Nitrospirota bacterium]|nr:hypothetical protein [Nitrospirota bacterium]
MAAMRLFADVLEEYHQSKKTGAMFVEIAGKSENLVRFFFKDGELCNLSFGPAKDRECIDILECYEFQKVVMFDGMKSPVICENLPPTRDIIEKMRACGKQVEISTR